MPFIGNQPALAYTSFAVQHFTTSATTSYTLDYPVANENEIRLVINNVVQQPGSSYAYTASGTSLTLSAATTATDTMYAVFLGKAVQTVNPPNGSVGLSQLSATGTKDSTTFLRGDNTFSTISTGFTSGTATATTSGTSFDFTGIPSTAKIIILNLHEVSLSGGDNLLVQIGDSGGFETADYLSTSAYAGASSSYTSDTGGFAIVSSSSTAVFSGLCFISLVDSSTNTWVSSHTGKHATNYVIWGGGSKSLSSTLTQVRLTRTGSNTFDNGKINILYI